MIRSRYLMLAAFLSLSVASMPLHAEETTSGKSESPAPKRHSTKSKRKHRTVKRTPSGQPKQYSHVVLEDVRVNVMGVHCAIKRVRLMYKGDGFDTAGVIERIIAAGEEEEAWPKIMKEAIEEVNLKVEENGKEPAELKRLAAVDKKEVKVVFWTDMALDPQEEFVQADRHLAVKLADVIRDLSTYNKDKVTIVDQNLVEQYKSKHPNWQALEPATVGRDFNADYVIILEINKLNLYEPNSNQQTYRGQTEILISVVDMKNPDDVQSKEFTDCSPHEACGYMTPLERGPNQFCDKFLQHVANRLACYFVDHPKTFRILTAIY